MKKTGLFIGIIILLSVSGFAQSVVNLNTQGTVSSVHTLRATGSTDAVLIGDIIELNENEQAGVKATITLLGNATAQNTRVELGVLSPAPPLGCGFGNKAVEFNEQRYCPLFILYTPTNPQGFTFRWNSQFKFYLRVSSLDGRTHSARVSGIAVTTF